MKINNQRSGQAAQKQEFGTSIRPSFSTNETEHRETVKYRLTLFDLNAQIKHLRHYGRQLTAVKKGLFNNRYCQ